MDKIRGPDKDNKNDPKQDYLNGMKYKDLAKKYKVSLNTVKSWVKRYKWSQEKKEKGAHKKKRGCTQKKNIVKSVQEPMQQEVKEVLSNSKLTDKQRLFCIYYIKYFNATKAYQKAYDSSYAVANVEGYRLLVKPSIKAEIDNLKKIKLNRAMLSPDDVFQKYIDIAFSDISDYVEFGQKEVQQVDDEGNPKLDDEGKALTYKYNYVSFKDSSEVDGTIISEVSQGKNGVSVKLQDKMKALKWLSDRMDLLPVETKIKIDNEKAKVEMAREKLELEKSKVNGDDNETVEDGFLEALNTTASEVWTDEQQK